MRKDSNQDKVRRRVKAIWQLMMYFCKCDKDKINEKNGIYLFLRIKNKFYLK